MVLCVMVKSSVSCGSVRWSSCAAMAFVDSAWAIKARSRTADVASNAIWRIALCRRAIDGGRVDRLWCCVDGACDVLLMIPVLGYVTSRYRKLRRSGVKSGDGVVQIMAHALLVFCRAGIVSIQNLDNT